MSLTAIALMKAEKQSLYWAAPNSILSEIVFKKSWYAMLCKGSLPRSPSERLQNTAVKEPRWPRDWSVHPAQVGGPKMPYLQISVHRAWKSVIPMQPPKDIHKDALR